MQIDIKDIIVPEKRKRSFSKEKAEQLKESINEIGLLNPVLVSEDHVLISGLHRIEACKALGWEKVEAKKVSYDEIDREIAEIDENLVRAELTVLERAEHLMRQKELYEAKHPETKKGQYGYKGREVVSKPENEIISFSEDVAKKIGVSTRTVQLEIALAKNIQPEIREALKSTPIANKYRDLHNLSRMQPEMQQKVAEKVVKDKINAVDDAMRLVLKEEKISQLKQYANKSDRWEIYNADMREWNAPRKYDLIFTDPPYTKDGMVMYKHLGEKAKEWLKPDGILIAKCGQMYLDLGIRYLSESMSYLWTIIYKHKLKMKQFGFVNVMSSYSVFLLYTNNCKYSKFFNDFYETVAPPEKEYHAWQQAVEDMKLILEQFCKPGDWVLDPFCGSGTFGAAALRCGAYYHGIEIDPKLANIARSRLAEEVSKNG